MESVGLIVGESDGEDAGDGGMEGGFLFQYVEPITTAT